MTFGYIQGSTMEAGKVKGMSDYVVWRRAAASEPEIQWD